MRTVTRNEEGLTADRPVRVLGAAFSPLGKPDPPTIPRGLPVAPYWLQGWTDYELHNHEHYEIGIVCSGQGTHETAVGSSLITAGSVGGASVDKWWSPPDENVVVLFNHVPGGSNVLFMDGHVAFQRYSENKHPLGPGRPDSLSRITGLMISRCGGWG